MSIGARPSKIQFLMNDERVSRKKPRVVSHSVVSYVEQITPGYVYGYQHLYFLRPFVFAVLLTGSHERLSLFIKSLAILITCQYALK